MAEAFPPPVFHPADLKIPLLANHRLVTTDLLVIHTHWEAETVEAMVVMILMILPLLHLWGNVILRSNQIEKITHYYEMTPCTDCGVTNFAP